MILNTLVGRRPYLSFLRTQLFADSFLNRPKFDDSGADDSDSLKINKDSLNGNDGLEIDGDDYAAALEAPEEVGVDRSVEKETDPERIREIDFSAKISGRDRLQRDGFSSACRYGLLDRGFLYSSDYCESEEGLNPTRLSRTLALTSSAGRSREPGRLESIRLPTSA